MATTQRRLISCLKYFFTGTNSAGFVLLHLLLKENYIMVSYLALTSTRRNDNPTVVETGKSCKAGKCFSNKTVCDYPGVQR